MTLDPLNTGFHRGEETFQSTDADLYRAKRRKTKDDSQLDQNLAEPLRQECDRSDRGDQKFRGELICADAYFGSTR